jgi:hypothetical protein
MGNNGNILGVMTGLLFLVLSLSSSALHASDYRFDVLLLRESDLTCGIKIDNNEVSVINVQPLLHDKREAVSHIYAQVPDLGLESPVPVLIEKAHLDGEPRRSALIRNAVRESAARGCDLLIVLDIAILDKLMFRPELMELKLPVSYVLVLFGSQIINSARRLDE